MAACVGDCHCIANPAWSAPWCLHLHLSMYLPACPTQMFSPPLQEKGLLPCDYQHCDLVPCCAAGLWQKVQDRIKRRKGDGSRADRKQIAEAMVGKLLNSSTKRITKAQVEAATRQPEPYKNISKSTVTEVSILPCPCHAHFLHSDASICLQPECW